MRKKFLALIMILGLMGLAASAAVAGPTLDRIAKTGEIRVGTDPHFPPMIVKAKNGTMMGFDADVANILAGAMGVKLRFVEIPFDDLLGALTAGKVDAVISGMTMTPKRNMKVVFSGPYLVVGQTILATNKVAASINGTTDLNEAAYTIAVPKGTTSQEAANGLLPKATKKVVDTSEQGLKLLLDGKVDMMMVDFSFASMAAFMHQDKGLAILGKPFTFEPLGIAIAPGDPEFNNLLDNFLITFVGSGQQDVVQKRWFQRSSWMKDMAE